MADSLVRILVHIVFSTKNREPYFVDSGLRTKLFAYMAGICECRRAMPIIVGGAADHIHILCVLAKGEAIATLVREIKRSSSKWMKAQNPVLDGFYWQEGYGAFSVSPIHVEMLRDYIANQERHHKEESFQVEFTRLLKRYGLEYDQETIWD